VIIDYEYSPRTEAVACALASIDGYRLGPEAYSVIAIPEGRAAAYWCRAVAAISAYESFSLVQIHPFTESHDHHF
jgi:hypothetical protein